MELKIEGLLVAGELADGLFHGIGQCVAHMLRRAKQRQRKVVLFQIGPGVGFGEAIEVAAPEFPEYPIVAILAGKADRLMSLRKATDVDIETGVFRKGLLTSVSADVVFADMRGCITVFAHRFSNGDCFGSHILRLFWSGEFCLLL